MKRFSARLFTLGLALGVLGAAAVLAAGASARGTAKHPTGAKESGQPVIDWNQVLLSIVNTPGAQPANVQPTRNFAILHAAIYDAVNAIDRTHEPYLIFVRAPRNASETAAADAAARTALVALYPAQQSRRRRDYAAELAKVRRRSGEGQRRPPRRAGRQRPARDPRERRLERHAAAVRRRHEPGRLPLDAAELPGARRSPPGGR